MASVTVTTGTGPASTAHRPVMARLAGLARAVESTRRRQRIDVRQALLLAGSVAMGLGFVAVALGWYGAAHSAYLFQEIPYLISGGLLGVALVAGGGFLFFGAWLVRLIEDNRRHAARVERTLERVDRVLSAIATDAAAAAGAVRREDADGRPAEVHAASTPGPQDAGAAGQHGGRQ